jgi:hypothetical protein
LSPKELLRRIDAHLARSGESPSAFGRRAANNPKVVSRLRAGMEPRYSYEQKILAAIRNYRRPKKASAAVSGVSTNGKREEGPRT